MEKVTGFTKKNIAEIHEEMLQALQGVAKKYGIVIEKNGGVMSPYKSTVKFDMVASVGDDGISAGQRNFERYSELFNDIDPRWFGKIFTVNGIEYKIVGINSKARKHPLELERVNDGATMKCSADYAKRYLSAEAK